MNIPAAMFVNQVKSVWVAFVSGMFLNDWTTSSSLKTLKTIMHQFHMVASAHAELECTHTYSATGIIASVVRSTAT